MALRIAFMGTPEFAVPSLKALLKAGYEIPAVITAPDRKGGRGMHQRIESAVKSFARDHGLRILQPKNLKDLVFLSDLRELNADLQVVVAFRMLPEVVWSMPPIGTLNLHASLMPKYRGAAPIHWAVINGEKETGLTTFLLKHEIDTGDILFQEKIPIGEHETTGDLHDRMMEAGAGLVLKTVKALETGTVSPYPQGSEGISKAPKIHHEDARINFDLPTVEVNNFIRGMDPLPGAWTLLDGKELKIYASNSVEALHQCKPGSYFSNQKDLFRYYTKDGYIEIKTLKLAGKRKMEVKDFLNGYELAQSTSAN